MHPQDVRPAVKATKVTEAVPDQGPIPGAAAQKRANDNPDGVRIVALR
jgi:hypothetical protein